jgi:pimeloyl-ACP methyl ester carboxylesterase
MDHVVVDGLRIAYRRQGAGVPLVLLHGAVCDSRVWRVEIERFAGAFDVVAWDAAGCDGSSDAPDVFSMQDYARTLEGFLDAVGVGAAHVLGHSWGSTLAFQLCVQAPARVRSVTVVGGYAGWAGSLPPDEVERRLAFALEAADALPRRFDPTSMPGLFSDAMPADRAQELAGIMSEIRAPATRTMARALADADLRPALESIEVPTLIVVGDSDVRSPVGVARELQGALSNSSVIVLPGVGHECYLEASDSFADVVLRFLSGVKDDAVT